MKSIHGVAGKLRVSAAALVALALAGSLSACVSDPPADHMGNTGFARSDRVAARVVTVSEATALPGVVDATRRLGTITLDLAPRDENVVVAPASLATAFAMLADGARGTSLTELEAALGASGDDRRDAFSALRGALLEFDGDPAAATADTIPERPIVHLADQVVVHEDFDVSAGFLDALAHTFDAGVQYTDLTSDAGKRVLDEWVNHHTGGLIEKSAIDPSPGLRLVLQDAILLAARWQTPFSAALTQDLPFTLSDGSTVDVATMTPHRAMFAYTEVDGWAAVRLPYVDAVHADVLLPPPGVDPADVSADMLAALSDELDATAPAPIGLTLPALDIEPGELDLLELLPALGFGSVVCGASPDLSGIAGSPGDLCVAQAAQQAVLKVDEEGTVAAAVTEIGVEEAAAPMIENEIHFDRPFLFTVSHSETGWPLFLTAVRDPRH